MDGWNALAQSYYISNFPHTQASPPWAAVTHQQASDAITNMQHQWNAYGRRLGATPWMAATEPMTRLAAVTATVPNAGMLLHQGALPIGMRREMANLLKAPAPPQGGGGGGGGGGGTKERQLAVLDAAASPAAPNPAATETNYYDVLGVDRSASPDDIRAAYKEKSRTMHPDKNNGDKEAFQKLNEANQVLSDPAQKAEYDRKTVADID